MVSFPEGVVFPNATVKEVVFQIRFANLFYLENRIGEFQLKVMQRFPESELETQQGFVFVQGRDKQLSQMSSNVPEPDKLVNVWAFNTEDKTVRVEVQVNSLTILTTKHKSYKTGEATFRETIEYVLKQFAGIGTIPIVSRIGLRYIDECPVIDCSSESFFAYYDSAMPIKRFPVEQCDELAFRTLITKSANRKLRYQETVKKQSEGCKLILDFDAFAERIEWGKILETTDELHSIIRAEYARTIKTPVLEYMQQKKD